MKLILHDLNVLLSACNSLDSHVRLALIYSSEAFFAVMSHKVTSFFFFLATLRSKYFKNRKTWSDPIIK